MHIFTFRDKQETIGAKRHDRSQLSVIEIESVIFKLDHRILPHRIACWYAPGKRSRFSSTGVEGEEISGKLISLSCYHDKLFPNHPPHVHHSYLFVGMIQCYVLHWMSGFIHKHHIRMVLLFTWFAFNFIMLRLTPLRVCQSKGVTLSCFQSITGKIE